MMEQLTNFWKSEMGQRESERERNWWLRSPVMVSSELGCCVCSLVTAELMMSHTVSAHNWWQDINCHHNDTGELAVKNKDGNSQLTIQCLSCRNDVSAASGPGLRHLLLTSTAIPLLSLFPYLFKSLPAHIVRKLGKVMLESEMCSCSPASKPGWKIILIKKKKTESSHHELHCSRNIFLRW